MRAAFLLCALLSAARVSAAPVATGPRPAPGVAGLASHELFPSAMHPRTRAAHKRIMAGWTVKLATGARAALKPADFGADPTCTKDSAPAFASLTQALLANYVVGNMSEQIKDLGGAVVDLDGGCYLTSQPLAIPYNYGNVHIQNGELRATADFPPTGSVVTVGSTACSNGQGSCNENVGLHSVTIDGSHVAQACLTVTATMGSVLDGSSAIFGFTTAGVMIAGGHEMMITDTWVAAYFWSSPMKEKTNATGIVVAGNDHYVSDTIVFSSRVGVQLTGAANILTGVHTWNCATGNGGTGILNESSQNRFTGCYLDYNDMVLAGSGAQVTTVLNGFFLGGGTLVFRAPSPASAAQSVVVSGNEWYYSSGPPVAVDETAGKWTNVSDVVIEGLAINPHQPYTNVWATKTVPAADSVTLDFSSTLLFPHVPLVPPSVTVRLMGATGSDAPLPVAVPAFPVGHTVTVFAPGTTGKGYTLTVTASQATPLGA